MVSLIYNVLILAYQVASFAQGPPPPNPDGRRPPQGPIDENIWILIVIGILFGIYMAYKKSRATNKVS